MPRASSKDPVGEDMLYQYKRPFFNQKLRREEAVADVQLIKRLIKEAKNSGFDSGSTKSQGSPR